MVISHYYSFFVTMCQVKNVKVFDASKTIELKIYRSECSSWRFNSIVLKSKGKSTNEEDRVTSNDSENVCA